MIQRLNKDKFHLIKDLVNPDYVSIQLASVILGTNPGIIYVDSVKDPKTAAVYHNGEAGYYFIGDSGNPKFNNHLKEFIEEQKIFLKEQGHDEFEFSGDSKTWETLIPSLFHPIKLNQSLQRVYLMKEKSLFVNESLHGAYTLEEIDSHLVNDSSVLGLNYASDEILEWWSTLEDYTQQGIGYVAMHGKTVVGRCLLDGQSNDLMGVGIAVKEAHRGRGLATLLASKTIEQIHARGCSPYWECMDSNTASIKLAERSGLALAFTYKLFGFMI